ncbi:MAG TPA: serine/threonine-protein kinase [Kofleriaceae bacterium]
MTEDPAHRATRRVAHDDTLPAADRPPPGGDTLLGGRYRLGPCIASGGMGDVFAADDLQFGREVAIKRIRTARPSSRMIERFLREAMVQGRLDHPAIVPVHEIGSDPDGLPYLVMKKVSGRLLREVLADGAPLHRALRAFADVCLAVELAHVRGVVHRDLKPDNIMLGEYGEVYVLDWGVAKILGEDDGRFADLETGGGDTTTRAVGTPGYMSPEQLRGDPGLDGRADVYILGCLLFEILAGEPLHARTPAGAAAEADARPSARARDRDIPPELDELCVQATARDRDRRLATARELGERVERFLDGDRDVVRRRALARDHLERGRGAFAAGSHQRALAMREAAAALALDPALDGAVELVGRLMLEPPREVPREVAEAMAAEDARDANAMIRTGLWVVAGALLFVPLMWLIAPPGSVYVRLLFGLLVADALGSWWVARRARPWPEYAVIANALILFVLGRMFSPLLVAPGIAAALAMAMVLTPRNTWLSAPITVSALMIGALVVPLGLEQLGVLPATMSVSGDGVMFRAPGVSGLNEPLTVVVGALYVISLVTTAVVGGTHIRERALAVRQRLELQAWQLRHLVPAG